MRLPVEPVRSSSRSRLALVLAIPFFAAGCSSESSRFGESAFSNPFRSNTAPSSNAPETTGSVPAQRPASNAQIESRPLPQASYQPQPPYQPQPQASYQPPHQPAPQARYQASYQPNSVPPPTRPATFNNNRNAASYQPASAPASDYTGSVRAPAPQAQAAPVPRQAPQGNSSNWQWEGGTAVTVAPGETLDSLSNRYGVPASAIAQSNGFAPNAPVHPGQRVVIPRYNYAAAPAAAPAPAPYTPPPAPAATRASVNTTSHRTAPVPSAQGQAHIVKPGETLIGLSRRYNRPIGEIASANNLQPYHKVQAGDRIIIPGAGRVAAASQPQIQHQPQLQQPRYAAAQAPAPTARMVTPAAEKPPVEETNSAEPSAGAPGFRWPARGRIITGFGPKPTGQQNDGINLALPEGTPVKAADDGVVAYAGNELKGYGNLVLIRHANGFVTAYAHASEVMVKRGDAIKRGQVIAKSGQTGNVTSPQLHFEIRKGASPVDPMQHLPGA